MDFASTWLNLSQLYGNRWYSLFARVLYPITLLPGFAKFRLDVLAGDARQKFEAAGNKQWTSNPAGWLSCCSYILYTYALT